MARRTAPGTRLLVDATRVALACVEDFLRADRKLLGLDNPANLTGITEGVVGRALAVGYSLMAAAFASLLSPIERKSWGVQPAAWSLGSIRLIRVSRSLSPLMAAS